MELESRVKQIRTRQDLVEFILALREDLESNPDNWENPSLSRFLEAMGAWVESMDQFYRNQGVEFSEQQPWELFGTMLLAARIYE
jgi:hypothetical protein